MCNKYLCCICFCRFLVFYFFILKIKYNVKKLSRKLYDHIIFNYYFYLFLLLKNILYLQIRQLPESVIVETTEYKCLQSQFSVLYNESMQLKTQLDDARQQLQSSKNAHLRHIEMMEVNLFFFFFS